MLTKQQASKAKVLTRFWHRPQKNTNTHLCRSMMYVLVPLFLLACLGFKGGLCNDKFERPVVRTPAFYCSYFCSFFLLFSPPAPPPLLVLHVSKIWRGLPLYLPSLSRQCHTLPPGMNHTLFPKQWWFKWNVYVFRFTYEWKKKGGYTLVRLGDWWTIWFFAGWFSCSHHRGCHEYGLCVQSVVARVPIHVQKMRPSPR